MDGPTDFGLKNNCGNIQKLNRYEKMPNVF